MVKGDEVWSLTRFDSRTVRGKVAWAACYHPYGGFDFLHRDGFHAQAVARASGTRTARAIDIFAQNHMAVAVGTHPARIGGTENTDHRRSHGCREVHGPRIVADEQLGAAEQRCQLRQTGLSRQVERWSGHMTHGIRDLPSLSIGADDNRLKPSRRDEPVGELCKPLGGPPLRIPPRSRVENTNNLVFVQ